MIVSSLSCGGARRPQHAISVLVTPPALEPVMTLDEAKLRAGLDWPAGDPRDALMTDFIAAARSKVEHDTGLALIAQTRDVFLDVLTDAAGVLQLPAQSRPLQAVTSVTALAADGTATPVDPATYVVDLASARIAFTGGTWPSPAALRALQPWVVRIVSGYATPADLRATAPQLLQAVGLMVAHYATLGRDIASLAAVTTVPFGYAEAIAPFEWVTVP